MRNPASGFAHQTVPQKRSRLRQPISGEIMRRFLTALVLASLLVVTFPATFPATYAQGASDKSKKASASTTIQRGGDTIAAAQLRDYLTFIASDEMEGRDTPSR